MVVGKLVSSAVVVNGEILYYDIRYENSNQPIASFTRNEYVNISLDDARELSERMCELYNTFGNK